MVYDVTQNELVSLKRRINRSHVVILGAGASLAAFPTGDAFGRQLPLMNNLIQVLGLEDTLVKAGLDVTEGFEAIYSQLYAADPNADLVRLIEQRVEDYFSKLTLPRYPTLYDMLLLSLRRKDAVFTFNWDPFLVDAYQRLAGVADLPHIYHLHGNVRVGFCAECGVAMRNADTCLQCDGKLTPTRLLHPVAQKNYTKDPFISSQWDQVRDFLGEAFMVTIFGYSAPTTDKEAMAIFNEAWKGDGPAKPIERVEVIDIRDSNELAEQWAPFAFYDHRDMHRSFYESFLARYPRRTCEALFHSGWDGHFVEPVAWAGNLQGLQNSIEELAAHEAMAYDEPQ